MTVSSILSRNDYTITGASVYPYTFRIFDEGDLVLTVASAAGIETRLVRGIDYTVSGAGSRSGGAVTLSSPAAFAGYALAIRRVLSTSQETAFRNQGAFFAESHEDAIDRLAMVDQQQQEQIGRAFLLAETDPPGNETLPARGARKNSLLGFDGDGKPVAVPPSSQSAVGVALELEAVKASVETFNQIKTGAFFKENGARINRINDRLFVGKSATTYDGKQEPSVKSWVGTPSVGIFEYLESNATFGAYAEQSGIGMFSAGRSSDTAGLGLEVSIGMATFVHNDLVNGLGGVWNFYGTALREAGTKGSTINFETDVANMGATVPVFPAAMFPQGLTAGLWIASGGEATNNQAVGTASVGLALISNDAGLHGPRAKFDKGIVIHSEAIQGCDGVNGSGVALAMARGHQVMVFNNSNQVMSEIVTTNNTVGATQRLDFTDYGLTIKERSTDAVQFKVEPVANAVNFIAAKSGAGTDAPGFIANGPGANINILLQTKGSGVLQVNYGSTAATNAANFVAARMLPFKDGNNILYYIPMATSIW
jgi:hypothetical protein